MPGVRPVRSNDPARVRVAKVAGTERLEAPFGEQRRGPRRRPAADRALVAPFTDTFGRHWIPSRWPYLILIMIAAVVCCAVSTMAETQPPTAALQRPSTVAAAD